jgi:DNA modification methylase
MDCLEFCSKNESRRYDLIIADPPYNDCVEDEWDNQWHSDGQYLEWLAERLGAFAGMLTKRGNLVVYCKRQLEHGIKTVLDRWLMERRTIIWARRRMMDNTRGKTLASGYEPIVWYSKSDGYIFNSELAKVAPRRDLMARREYQEGGILEGGVSLSDVWSDIPALTHNSKEKVDHSTQKPLELCKRIVKLFSKKDSRIFVPFAGSGSELEACAFFGRKWDACEVNERYALLIKRRLKNCQRGIELWF